MSSLTSVPPPFPTEDVSSVLFPSSSNDSAPPAPPPILSQAWTSSFDEDDEDFIRRCLVELANISIGFNTTSRPQENTQTACEKIAIFKNSSDVVLDESMKLVIVVVYR